MEIYKLSLNDMNSNKMDNWNLHTLDNKGVKANKLKLCTINNATNMRDIFNYILKNTKLNLKEICPNIYDYLENEKFFSVSKKPN